MSIDMFAFLINSHNTSIIKQGCLHAWILKKERLRITKIISYHKKYVKLMVESIEKEATLFFNLTLP